MPGYRGAHWGERVAGNDDTWNVIVLGWDAPDEVVIAGLQREFGVDPATAQRLTRATPRAVKHDVPREVALRYGAALSAIGGRYELQPSDSAFMETSAGEHVSPVVHIPRQAALPRDMAVSDSSESFAMDSRHFSLHADHNASVDIDVAASQRVMTQGNKDSRGKPISIARAEFSSFPPGASQSLPPPRVPLSRSLPPEPQVPATRNGTPLIVAGVALWVLSVVARSFFVDDLAMVGPVLKGVGGLLAARGVWIRLSN